MPSRPIPPLPGYAELFCRSNFSFLSGASHPEELIARAQSLRYQALAITDECSLAGVVRAHVEAQRLQFHLIIGAEMQLAPPGLAAPATATAAGSGSPNLFDATPHNEPLADPLIGPRLVLLAQTRRGYCNLVQWITVARRRAPKGQYLAQMSDLEGQVPTAPTLAGLPGCLALLLVTPQPVQTLLAHAHWLKRWFGDRARPWPCPCCARHTMRCCVRGLIKWPHGAVCRSLPWGWRRCMCAPVSRCWTP